MEFRKTTALLKLLATRKKIRDVRGSTGAGKTIGITMWDIDFAQSLPNQIIDIVSESYPHMEQGVMRDFKNIMSSQGYWRDSDWNDTKHYYTFKNKSQIHFQSYDKLGKAHGPRRDVLHLNEANYLPWNVVDQLITRTRKVVWAEYNPSIEFWMHEEILGKRDDVESLKLTYKDNEGLSESEVAEIESHKNNKAWWTVYGLGELGSLEGQIFKWQQIDEVPQEARLLRRYLDYGYTNDPTAIGDIYKWNDAYVLDEILYQKGLSNKQIADVILNLPEQVPVAADSAEPKSNDELSNYGITVLPARKGKDSVNSGIQLVQQQKLFVTKRSINIIKEQRNYLWDKDKQGKSINVPIPIWNHHMDGIRYGFESLINFVPDIVRTEQKNQFERNRWGQKLNSAR